MKNLTILYADDDADDCALLYEALAQIDPSIKCLIANDGKEALKLLKSTSELPSSIFLDINMPVMDGKKCLQQLKSDQKLKDIPVVIWSTTNNEKEVSLLYLMGAAEFRSKPNTFNELCDSLASVIFKLKAGAFA